MASPGAARMRGMRAVTDAPPRRLFTALFPPDDVQAEIDRLRRHWQELPRKLRPALHRMHLTLQFQPAVAPPQEAAWLAALSRLDLRPFDLALVRAELWHSGHDTLAVLRPAASAELDALHAATDALAREAGLTPQPRRWKPHVTILRQAGRIRRVALAAPIRWQVRSVDLVWSDLDGNPPRYRVLARCPAHSAGDTDGATAPAGTAPAGTPPLA